MFLVARVQETHHRAPCLVTLCVAFGRLLFRSEADWRRGSAAQKISTNPRCSDLDVFMGTLPWEFSGSCCVDGSDSLPKPSCRHEADGAPPDEGL